MVKGSTAIAVVFVMLGATTVGMLSSSNKKPELQEKEGWDTVCYDLPTDGSTPDLHSALENIGYMNRRLKDQTAWYSEMHGQVNTIIKQDVSTYKQYSDGVLISTEISNSSMVNAAKQLCFVGDSVLWREAATSASQWNGIDTEWKTGEPTKLSVENFKKNYGLPGTAFSVYILNEDTLLGADEVVDHGDGTYSQTCYLNPETDKAPFYYRQQMLKTGGLSKWPSFTDITVTFTFDATWQILSSSIEEAYGVNMGPISTDCTAAYLTEYEYMTDKSESSVYRDYFSQYEHKEDSDLPENDDPTAVGCLSSAFGGVLTAPAMFALDLNLNGIPVTGAVYADINNMDFRARLGNLYIWYMGDAAYVRYGNVQAKLTVSQLMALLSEYLPTEGAGAGLDTDALLEQLGAGEFTISEGKAALRATLSLMGLELPVDFSFLLDEDNNASLDCVRADVAIKDFKLNAALRFGDEQLPALTAEQAAAYPELSPYLGYVLGLVKSDVFRADISYRGNGLTVSGEVSLSVADLTAQGTLHIGYDGKIKAEKTVAFGYGDGIVYLNLDGIKIKAGVKDALQLIGQFVDLPQGEAIGIDLNGLLNTLFTPEFAANFTSSESDNTLQLAVKGTELLKAFGVDFELGNVVLSVNENGLTASALGAEVTVGKGAAFELSTEGYTDLVKYAGYLAELFTSENFAATVTYSGYGVSVAGELKLNLKNLQLAGEFTVSYKNIAKQLFVQYADETVYLNLDGIKVKANVQEAIALVKQYVSIPESDVTAADMIEKVLSLNLGEVIMLGEADDSLQVTVKGTEMLKALGIDFALGNVVLSVNENGLAASAMGAEVTVSKGAAFELSTEGYTDLVKYSGYLAEMLTSENFAATVSYSGYGVSVAGELKLNLKNLQLAGEFTVSYKNITKQLTVQYADETVYLNLDGIKVKANVQEAITLVKQYVSVPESDVSAAEMIEKVLSLNLGEVITLGEADDALQVTLKGTELLKALGIDFALGNVVLSVNENGLTANALGAEVTVRKGAAFELSTVGYTDLVKYAGYFAELVTSENFAATVSYSGYGVSVAGELKLNLKNLQLAGEFTVSYKNITKQLFVQYADEIVYLNLDGIKVKANVQEALALIKQYVSVPESDINAADMIEKVLSLNLGEVITLGEEDDALQVTLKGTELLKALGIDFALGNVELSVNENGLTASALGAEVTVSKGTTFELSTEGYTDLVKYAGYLAELLTSENFAATVNYSGYGVSVAGDLKLNIKNLQLAGEFTVSYKNITKQLFVQYADDLVYLQVDGLKIKTSVSEAITLVKQFVAIPESDCNATEVLEKALALDFDKLFALAEEENTLTLTANGTELFKALGIDFALGDVVLSVNESGLTATALGATVSLSKSAAFVLGTNGYTDISGIPTKIVEIVNAKSVSLGGEIALNINGAQVVLSIDRGVLTWDNGLGVYLDMTLVAASARHNIVLSYRGNEIALSYGSVGAKLVKEELPTLDAAFVALYNRIKAVVDEIAETQTSPMPQITKFEDLLTLLNGGKALTETFKAVDEEKIFSLVNQLQILPATQRNGIVTLKMGEVALELLKDEAEGGALTLQLNVGLKGVAVSAEIHAAAYRQAFPSLPQEVSYLTVDDLCELTDYIGAAVETVTEQDVTLGFTGQTTSTDLEKYPDGVKYDISATLKYHAGSTFPIHVDLDGRNFWLNTDMYVYAEVALTAHCKDDQSLWIEMYLLDANADGTKDGVLDLYLSVSTMEKGKGDPFKVYAPVSDMMTIVSSLVSMSGIENEFINDILVGKWLNAETVAQLKAVGGSLLSSTGLDQILGGLFGKAAAVAEDDSEKPTEPSVSAPARNGAIKSVEFGTDEKGDRTLNIALDSKMIYGAEMPQNIVVSLAKQQDENSFYLTGIALKGVYSKADAAEKTDVETSITRACEQTVPVASEYFNFSGVDSLIKTIAHSATHVEETVISGEKTEHIYRLNNNYYISGNVTFSLAGIERGIDVVAISVTVDENDQIGINIRLEYESAILGTVIKEDSTLDLTIKNGNVYMKRISKSGTFYRVSPLDKFFNNIFDHLGFMLNFGSLVSDQLKDPQKQLDQTYTDNLNQVEQPQAERVDIGTTVKQYLSGYGFNGSDSAPVWTVVLNGGALTDNVMGDITVVLNGNADNVLTSLALNTKLMNIFTLKGNLTFRNPCGVMENSVQDITQDIEKEIGGALDAAIASTDWTPLENRYLAAKSATVTYKLGGAVLGTQSVYYLSDKDCLMGASCTLANGTLLTPLVTPDVSEYQKLGYLVEWNLPATVTGDTTVEASYAALTYPVTLYSKYMIDGFSWVYDGNKDCYVAKTDYVFGTEGLLVPENYKQYGNLLTAFRVGDNDYTSIKEACGEGLPPAEMTAVWQPIEYTVSFAAEGNVFATQTAHYGDAVRYPADMPVIGGYTFTGWSDHNGTVTDDVTVTAVYSPKTVYLSLHSDAAFAGASGTEDGSYYFDWNSAAGDVLPVFTATDGNHNFYGWWKKNGDAYTRFTDSDIDLIRRAECWGSTEVWAVWTLKTAEVVITDATHTSSWGLHSWYVKGHCNAMDGKSLEIANTAGSGISFSATAKYGISKNGTSMNADLNWNKYENANADGTFEKTVNGSTNGTGKGEYGGCDVKIVVRCSGLSDVTVEGSGWKHI